MINPPGKTRVFEKSSVIETSLDAMIRFHEAPRALASLTPPGSVWPTSSHLPIAAASTVC
ncbi:MAG: hypothetical protein OXG78_15565 [Chloroflexi bacterium]|nr:hypothetical protein [Chloroflexota bacterium]